MTTYKVGAAWNVTDQLVWRFGYSVGEQPIRAPDALFNILAPGVMEQHFTTGFTARRGEREYSLAFMFAPKKTITGNNLFDPTQTLDLSMRQFELEFSMRF
jgi:long-chain fatty acid transport protein